MLKKGIVAILLLSLVGGCAMVGKKNYKSASLVDYLYPDKNAPLIEPDIPKLKVPVRVGVAFVPGGFSDAITEKDKQVILDETASHFEKYQFIDRVEVIPSAYMRAGGGFDNLDQLRRLFGVDLIALVSYDQNQFTDEGLASVTYWTIVGAYIVPGEKNSTHTLMDTVVYDVSSRNLLFRAPGVSQVKSKSTLVNLSEQQRLDSGEGFKLASTDMIKNLDLELTEFKELLKKQPERAKVEYRKGYSGGGSLGWFGLVLMIVASVGLFVRRSPKVG